MEKKEDWNFSTKGAAQYLKEIGAAFTPNTLEVWRCQGRGPRFKKIARKVFYEKSALDEFVRGQSFETLDSINQG